MNRKTMLARLKAGEDPLELSIEKWRDIVDGKGRDSGESNCALCETHKEGYRVNCEECRIYIETGQHSCDGTPQERYVWAKGKEKEELARAELEFLKSLRKEATP